MNENDLDKAINMIRRGDKYSGYALLEKILAQEPVGEIVWLKLADIEENDISKLAFLENALKVNPSNLKAMEEIIILLSKDKPKYMKYFEEVDQEINTISLGQFLTRYESAVANKKDIKLRVVYGLSGVSEDFGGYAIEEKTQFCYENGKLEIFTISLNT